MISDEALKLVDVIKDINTMIKDMNSAILELTTIVDLQDKKIKRLEKEFIEYKGPNGLDIKFQKSPKQWLD